LRDYVWAARQQFRGAWDAGGAVSVDAEFRFARAPRAGDAGEGQTLVVVRQLPPDGYRAKQPDVDNLAKLVLEAVDHAGIVVDDRQVVELAARKIHGVAAPRARQGGE
jgi:Holliday junction resolvase RusA-like endonuclease